MENLQMLIEVAVTQAENSIPISNSLPTLSGLTKEKNLKRTHSESFLKDNNNSYQEEYENYNKSENYNEEKNEILNSSYSNSSHNNAPLILDPSNYNLKYLLPFQTKKDIFHSIMNAFNLNDITIFKKVLQDFAAENVIISSKSLRRESIGLSSLLILWILILEGYPDAVITTIKTREISNTCVEYSFMFAGNLL